VEPASDEALNVRNKRLIFERTSRAGMLPYCGVVPVGPLEERPPIADFSHRPKFPDERVSVGSADQPSCAWPAILPGL